MIKREEIIPVGKFQKTHALKGELNLILEIDPDYFLEGNPLIIDVDSILVPFYVTSIRPKGSTSYLVKLEGVNDETTASAFVNKEVYMLIKDADEWLEEDPEDVNFFIGFKVIDAATNQEIGDIEDVDDTTENVLFILRTADDEIVYLPANQDFVDEINEEGKFIRMNLPEGLIDLNK
ncbi:MAG: 16S rRNA processing protein RimM [Muribaculaceae bacterium]|nr:16S rRNA processing protein RimM [Muribaculaceae bacterium]